MLAAAHNLVYSYQVEKNQNGFAPKILIDVD